MREIQLWQVDHDGAEIGLRITLAFRLLPNGRLAINLLNDLLLPIIPSPLASLQKDPSAPNLRKSESDTHEVYVAGR